MTPQNPSGYSAHRGGITDGWGPGGVARWRGCLNCLYSPPHPPPQSLLPHFSGQPVDPMRLDRLLGKLKPALRHLDQEVLATKPFLATEQLSLADLMAFTELMQVSFSCLLAFWGGGGWTLDPVLSPLLWLPCLPSPLLSAVTSSKTGPGWQRGEPEWRLLWVLSLSRMPTSLCCSLGTPEMPSGTPSWPRSWCRDCWSGSAERGVARPGTLLSPAHNKHGVCPLLVSSLTLP